MERKKIALRKTKHGLRFNICKNNAILLEILKGTCLNYVGMVYTFECMGIDNQSQQWYEISCT